MNEVCTPVREGKKGKEKKKGKMYVLSLPNTSAYTNAGNTMDVPLIVWQIRTNNKQYRYKNPHL